MRDMGPILAELEHLRKENELNKQTLEEIKKTEWELAGEETPIYLLAHYRLSKGAPTQQEPSNLI